MVVSAENVYERHNLISCFYAYLRTSCERGTMVLEDKKKLVFEDVKDRMDRFKGIFKFFRKGYMDFFLGSDWGSGVAL